MIQEIIIYKNILACIGDLIENSPFKKSYIIEKIGMTAPTFYRKLKNYSFTPDETLRIVSLLKPEEANIFELKESLKRGFRDFENNDVFTRDHITSEIEKLLL